MKNDHYKFVFAGGGTGGHLFPAIAVAEQLRIMSPKSKIMFVGTKKKIESRVIPQLGFSFKSIWISGLSRKFTIKNLLFPLKLIVSIIESLIINVNFKPNVAIGAGAYVSGPIIWIASLLGAKIILLEQNSYPGVTNRLLERRADSIHISFEDSKKYFKNISNLKLTGNPVRTTLELIDREEALKEFSLAVNKKVLLVIGGSLGARSINNAVVTNLSKIVENDIQIIWQTGDLYYEEYKKYESKNVRVFSFINSMALAYSSCDLVLARAGATTIAEVAYLGLPVVFVPSQNVAANHQYKNAKSLADNGAGILIEDDMVSDDLGNIVIENIRNEKALKSLKNNIKKYSKPNAAIDIANDILRLAQDNVGN